MPDQNLFEKLKVEVRKSLLMNEEDKKYWLENAESLPKNLVEYFCAFLKKKNDIVDTYVDSALQTDPRLLAELKNRVSRLKKNILKFKEQGEITDEKAETFLEEELKKI